MLTGIKISSEQPHLSLRLQFLSMINSVLAVGYVNAKKAFVWNIEELLMILYHSRTLS